MRAFTVLSGLVLPLDRSNVDTDAIIPKQFLKSVKRTGFGPNLFDEWRYLDHGEPGMDNGNRPANPDFVLNFPRYRNAEVLLARENFGCGSSREHAPWALLDYGIRCVIAPSYADIFFNNCFKNGILPITLNDDVIQSLFEQVEAQPGYSVVVDLPNQTITDPHGEILAFEVETFRKHCLVNGLDDIGLTLQHSNLVKEYEEKRKLETPWLFNR
ncbi:MAG: 3-isopropylmalate dehydratase small subunit [Gammaproteobacteria bacterium]|nr:3-isopropylmalate dehydratase small subunit [Gammaproteobacteria bacterium]